MNFVFVAIEIDPGRLSPIVYYTTLWDFILFVLLMKFILAAGAFLDEHHPALQHHKPVMTSLKQGSKADKFSLKSRIARRRNNPRYKTQPITFDEIKEVEEPDNGNNNESDSNTNTVSALLSKNTTADVNTVQCAYVH